MFLRMDKEPVEARCGHALKAGLLFLHGFCNLLFDGQLA